MAVVGRTFVRIEGLKELEERLAQLRSQFDAKTGGMVYRGVAAGARVIRDEAKARAPAKDPSGLVRIRERALAEQKAGKRRRGRKLRRTLALIRANIVSHLIPFAAPLSEGRPTAIVRVRNRGYERGFGGSIRFKNPGTSPGYWWWVEFGTSKLAARPFMRPAAEAARSRAVTAMRETVAKEIDKFLATVRHR